METARFFTTLGWVSLRRESSRMQLVFSLTVASYLLAVELLACSSFGELSLSFVFLLTAEASLFTVETCA